MGRLLGRWARDEDGARTGLPMGLVEISIEGIPKVSITVLKVGTVTPLLGSKLLDPQKKKNKKKNILCSSCDTVVTLSSHYDIKF